MCYCERVDLTHCVYQSSFCHPFPYFVMQHRKPIRKILKILLSDILKGSER